MRINTVNKKEISQFLNENLIGAGLDSFGIRNQFLELKFSSDKLEEIKFFIDCAIYSNDKII